MSRLPRRVTLAALCLKLVIQPALLTLLVVAALALRLFAPPDPMFLLTMLLSNATPTAINMQARESRGGSRARLPDPPRLPSALLFAAAPCCCLCDPPCLPSSPHHLPFPRNPTSCMQTLMVLYQHGEAEMSTLLQWQYLASVLTLPAFMWAFLRIIAAWL